MLDSDPLDPDHEYDIVTSDTPVTVDGYAKGEPKKLACHFCEADIQLSDQETSGVWEIDHEPWCPDVSRQATANCE